jgi:2-phosphoglycerate kinase
LLVWVDFIRSGRPLIFLIGGTAGCGKSTIATALANRLDIVRMQSTDMLREVMRTMIPERLLPVLHTSSFKAGNVLAYQEGVRHTETSDELLVRGYRTQASLLSIAIEAAYERALRERVSLIVEGVHIHPALVEALPRHNDAVVIPIMLGVLKRKELQKRISGRGIEIPGRRARRYLEYFDQIWRLQTYLLSEADRANTPIITNNDREKVLREIMRATIGTLATRFDRSPGEVFR